MLTFDESGLTGVTTSVRNNGKEEDGQKLKIQKIFKIKMKTRNRTVGYRQDTCMRVRIF